MEDGFRHAVDFLANHYSQYEFARKPAAGQRGFSFDENEHPRESSAHDGKKPGEFAPKPVPTKKTSDGRKRNVNGVDWEYSPDEGLWFASVNGASYRVGRSDIRGQYSEWVMHKNNKYFANGSTMKSVMEQVSHSGLNK